MKTTNCESTWDGKSIRRINHVALETQSTCIQGKEFCVFTEIGTTGATGETNRNKSARSFLQLDFRHGDFFIEPTYEGERCVGVTLACCGDESVNLLTATMVLCQKMLQRQKLKIE